MIAAGEVVERPASVVKELCENAFDAGATAVTVEIRAGGLTYIRVSDNGCGIAKEDAENAFLRHATSKLRDERGLEAIETLGFRGEALAAIASVSRIELITRPADEAEGTRVELEGGEGFRSAPAGRPAGTTITVRDLFYNTPARAKFMKTDRSEAAAVRLAIIKLALSRPDISVRYIRDGTEELYTPGDSREDSAVYTSLGRDFAVALTPVKYSGEGASVTGYVSTPGELRGNRNGQYFIVNGRCVRSHILQAALEQAYRNRNFTGRFPACVLWITINPARLDVNVHPAKTEIRLLFEKDVFDAVYYGSLSALDEPPEVREARAAAKAAETDALMRSDIFGLGSGGDDDDDCVEDGGANARFAYGGAGFVSKVPAFPERDYTPPVRDAAQVAYRTATAGERGFGGYGRTETAEAPPEPELTQSEIVPDAPYFRVVGEAMNTYIICEYGGGLWLIDKHAAHERMHFDALLSGVYDPMPQLLVTPAVIPSSEGAELLLENAELLDGLGFEIEDFGGAAAVRTVPGAVDAGDAETVLGEIANELSLGSREPTARRDAIFASVACKAAIKAGRLSEESELRRIAERVFSGEVRFCPHGRPVAFEITKSALDKAFKRI
jgi:DNA mismatch repair protein MutL